MAAAAERGPVGIGDGDGAMEIAGVLDGADPIVSVHATVAVARTTEPAVRRARYLTGAAG